MDKEQAIELIRECAPSSQADLLIGLLLPSARITVHDGSGIDDSTSSHFGGLPSLPPNTRWPVWDKENYLKKEIVRLEEEYKAYPRASGYRDTALHMREQLASPCVSLAFLAQLFLHEVQKSASLPGWPDDGSLVFFYDPSQETWGFDPMTRGHCRVFFFSGDQQLVPTAIPKDIPDEARFPHRRVEFRREWTLPTTIRQDGFFLSIWGDDSYLTLCQKLMGSFDEREPIHRCGGHPQEIQGEMRLECQLVTNGLYCGNPSGYHDPRRILLEKGAADWQLLLQVDSDEKRLGWMWGDVGRVYFWARRQDIKISNFDASWAILQCY